VIVTLRTNSFTKHIFIALLKAIKLAL
jgi:hypothetical protein